MLRQLNEERLIRRLGVTRRALLEELDRLHLKELPGEAYCFAEWRLRRVGLDYHVDVEAHFYSVPYRFARREVEVRLTPRTVEVFLKGDRIAAGELLIGALAVQHYLETGAARSLEHRPLGKNAGAAIGLVLLPSNPLG